MHWYKLPVTLSIKWIPTNNVHCKHNFCLFGFFCFSRHFLFVSLAVSELCTLGRPWTHRYSPAHLHLHNAGIKVINHHLLANCYFFIRLYYLPVNSAANELDSFNGCFRPDIQFLPIIHLICIILPLCADARNTKCYFLFPWDSNTRCCMSSDFALFFIFFRGQCRAILWPWWSHARYSGLIFSFVTPTGLHWFPKSKRPTFLMQLIYDFSTASMTSRLSHNAFFMSNMKLMKKGYFHFSLILYIWYEERKVERKLWKGGKKGKSMQQVKEKNSEMDRRKWIENEKDKNQIKTKYMFRK